MVESLYVFYDTFFVRVTRQRLDKNMMKMVVVNDIYRLYKYGRDGTILIEHDVNSEIGLKLQKLFLSVTE